MASRVTKGKGARTRANGAAPRRRQAEIIDAAARVFHEKGYEATSIQDIADAVGILKGSLYYYIDSKEDLLFEIIRDVHQRATAIRTASENTPGDPLQKIRAFVVSHFTFNAENLIPMGVFFHDFRCLSKKRQRQIAAERDPFTIHVRELVSQGQKDHLICPDLDPQTTTMFILGATNWMYHWYKPGGPRSANDIANDYADLIVAGLACTPTTHTPGHRRHLDAAAGPAGQTRP